ncbi:hydrogenase expression protein HypF [Streptomyces sp. NPDC050610]|uniref:hydrogenase expression protein HypF n=1 Tax=Streptomyces sp. NPDC050610 TaxID=3157097 RepID=UPI00343960C7
MPAGKAIAIAAMPSAVLMGLGFTPQLAQAKPLPKNPFQDGPCVTAPDQKTDADGKDEKDAKDGKSKDDSKSKDGKGDDKAKGEQGKDKPKGEKTVTGTIGDVPSPSASGDKEAKDKSEGKTKDKDKDKPEDKSPSPSPHTATPSPSATHNPLDPLGLGDKIKDLLNGGHGKDEGKPAQPSTPTPTATPTTGGNSAADQKPAGEEPSPDKASGDAPSDQADKDDKKADEKDDKKADQKDPSATPSPDPTPTPTTTPDADGKKPYPCVVEKKSGGKDEQTPVGLPNQPWTLKSDLITMHNLQYHGVVNLRTADGRTKQALKFTMNSASIHNLDQTADQGVGGKRTYVRGGKGTTSTIDGGITMYTESLKGNLFGLLPVTFTPDFPPPITPPEIFFSDFTAIQAGQFGGTLRIPGLHSGME